MRLASDVWRVAVDGRDLNRGYLRGQGRYAQEIIRRMARLHPVQWELCADRPDLPFHRPEVEACNVWLCDQRGYRWHAWEQFALPRRVRQVRADILHCPGMRLPYWQPIPTVVTLHDAMPWLGNECGWPRGWYTDHVIPGALKQCAAVITVSEHSKRDILTFWPDLESKLHVIPNGVGEHFLSGRERRLGHELLSLGLQSPYFLYVGGSLPRKRLDWAIKVFSRVRDTTVSLAICGLGHTDGAQILASVAPEVRQRMCVLPFIDEHRLPALYQNAVAVLYPTLYEGFGLPALEAQAVGTPVVFSAIGSLLDLKGPGAIVVPPQDLEAWVAVCQQLLQARREHRRPDPAARSWARQFSWDVSAEKHLGVYQDAIRTRVR